MSSLNTGVIPLAVLCAGLVVGVIVTIFVMRRISRVRLLRQIALAQEEAVAEELFLNTKPVLSDVYIGPPPDLPDGVHRYDLPWGNFQPIAGSLNRTQSCPHPHRTIENKPGYLNNVYVDGNIIDVTVGIVMPSSSLNPTSPYSSEDGPAIRTLDYCLGTTNPVICSLLGARQRLVGIN